MLIEYDAETINLETPTSRTEADADAGINEFIPTFTINDLAYYKTNSIKEGIQIGKVFGDITLFQTMNQGNYLTITKLPREVEYFIDYSKSRIPSSEDEVFKLQARDIVESEVGDVYDLIADVSKRLTMLERLGIRLADDLITYAPEHVPTITTMYSPLIQSYLALLTAHGNSTNLADLEDPQELFLKLFNRNLKIMEIVDKNYVQLKN